MTKWEGVNATRGPFVCCSCFISSSLLFSMAGSRRPLEPRERRFDKQLLLHAVACGMRPSVLPVLSPEDVKLKCETFRSLYVLTLLVNLSHTTRAVARQHITEAPSQGVNHTSHRPLQGATTLQAPQDHQRSSRASQRSRSSTWRWT